VIAALAAALLFAWLAMEVMRGNTLGFDLAVRGAIHSWSPPLLTRAMRGATQLGEPWFLIPLGLLLAAILVRRRRKRAALVLTAAPIGAEILDQLLKAIFHRARPDAFFDFPQPENYSFPSGHAFASACFYGALAAILAASSPRRAPAPDPPGTARVRKRTLATGESGALLAYARGSGRRAAYWALGIAVPLLIGFSRVYLGVHYPTDVLAGYAAAVVWLTIVFRCSTHTNARE
jgi:undecaprenyl-diphosphatase